MDTNLPPEAPQFDADEIPLRHTGARIVLTLLFMVVTSVIHTILWALVLFCLLWTLITRQPPLARIRALANRVVAYEYRIRRYVTYNESEVPFPFSDLPEAVEPGNWCDERPSLAALGLDDTPNSAPDEFENA